MSILSYSFQYILPYFQRKQCKSPTLVCLALCLQTSLRAANSLTAKKTSSKDQCTIAQMAPETLGSALYNELRGCSHSGSLGSRNYIANSELFRIVTEDSIVAELKEHSGRWSLDRYRLKIMKELAGDILKSCPKLFATLVHLELPWGIKNLLDAGLTDEDLPLSKQLNCLKSCRNPAKSFKWPVKWKAQKLDHFVEKQWLLMAPTFCTNGAHTDLSLECPLPFKSADEVQNGVNNVLYRVSVDPSHHKGFEVSIVPMLLSSTTI